ncbi:Uncharacterised protein [Mycobacterium tuberculosis]|uniref:Uncharacterized protein n=1 Tax=Mycobacterium tuberculosis TaxID=1773 RepID=A0A655ESZ8_MYCTX|nr:Uncharacterised protein [Mycobacterium tuberculosis]CKS70314.1 Uncharacterised protein [Mycobacterium tuberculosis]CKT21111.1 Uncharacterised protein [Mycobacterium tuberculosis]CKT61113.1 Uncharacterised protein [Mycobacterium tuberculosis]CNL91287.1 Uncharacterised protein [Mycobacterium tuberculosis]
MQLSGQQHVKLVGRAVGEQAGAAEFALWFEVRQQRGTRQNQDRDDDAKSDRAAVELQRVVKHPGVPAHDGVFEPAQQKTPAANLNLGGEAKPHSSFSHVEVCVHRGDSLRHI